MKQQIVYIHGGDPHETHEAYISFLKNYVIDNLSYFKRKRWSTYLQDKLGNDFDVISPKMPNDRNAKYAEWKIWFEKFISLLDDNVILIGSSLGAIFLTKYLSENKFPKSIKAIFLIAAPFDTEDTEYSLADFTLPKDLDFLSNLGSKVTFYHSKDDIIVPFVDLSKYQAKLPMAKCVIFEDRGHFSQEEFTELINDIKNLS